MGTGEYLGILLMIVASCTVIGALLLLAHMLGPRHPSPTKESPFECGMEPLDSPSGRSSVKFYLIAVLFILFDVELIYLFPWAVVFDQLGWFGLAEIAFFLAALGLGYLYAYQKGALEWEE